jgi:hypothetical protein
LQRLISLNNRIIVNDELERMWKEGVVACFNGLYQCLLGITEENYETPG